MRLLVAFLALALAGCVATPHSKPPAQAKVDGWVEKGGLTVVVYDERPLTARKTYDTGPLGLPSIGGLTPDRVVDEYAALDEKYSITDMLLPDTLAAGVKKLLPPPPHPSPVGVERTFHPAVVRVSSTEGAVELATDETGHARASLAPFARSALAKGAKSLDLALDVADEDGHGKITLSRNDLLALAEDR